MEYILKRNRRATSIRLRLNHDGEILVSAPNLMPKFLIDRFVNSAADWIEKQKRKVGLKKNAFPIIDWENKLLSFKGVLRKFALGNNSQRIKHIGELIEISPVVAEEKYLRQTLLAYLKREAESLINKRVEYFAKKMECKFKIVKFKQQRSRWGSCTSSGVLSFNWRLIHFKDEIIDYVVIHELAHTKHMDHSGNFWGFVKRFAPAYKECKKFLHHQIVAIEK